MIDFNYFLMELIKQQLYNMCGDYVVFRIQKIQNTMVSYQNDLKSETKSSAGDKHETGRAMLHLEMEKLSQQLKVVRNMKGTLQKMNLANSSFTGLGSLIITTNARYFLSISIGKLLINEIEYLAISVSSPIGKILLQKQVGDDFEWNGIRNKIVSIS